MNMSYCYAVIQATLTIGFRSIVNFTRKVRIPSGASSSMVCVISTYPILSYLILSYPILSYPISYCIVQSYSVLSCPVLSYPILSVITSLLSSLLFAHQLSSHTSEHADTYHILHNACCICLTLSHLGR